MKYLLVTLLTLSLSALIGCGEKESGASITRNSGIGYAPGPNNSLGGSSSSGGNWGQLLTDSQYQEEFNTFAYGLVASTKKFKKLGSDFSKLGSVSTQWGNSTGIFITSVEGPGKTIAVLESDRGIHLRDIQSGNIPYMSINSTKSSLGVLVEGSKEFIEVLFESAVGGSVRGDYAEIKFSDEYGSMSMDGYFSIENGKYVFSGTFRYANDVIFGDEPGSGSVGFKMHACSFFKCVE